MPTYTGAGWYGYTYKTHLAGAQTYFSKIAAPKKMVLTGPAHPDRPLRALRGEMLRWYDHWLKGIDTGVMEEPPVSYWVMGANEWRTAPIGRCRKREWTKLYLHSWERLRPSRYVAVERGRLCCRPTCSRRCRRRRPTASPSFAILTDPLPHDLLVAGTERAQPFCGDRPGRHQLDHRPQGRRTDASVRTAREGEREIPTDLPERELTRGWLKASNRALDPDALKAVEAVAQADARGAAKGDAGQDRRIRDRDFRDGNSSAKAIAFASKSPASISRPAFAAPPTSNIFPITSARSRTVVHRIYHDAAHPSHLLLPVIPTAVGQSAG